MASKQKSLATPFIGGYFKWQFDFLRILTSLISGVMHVWSPSSYYIRLSSQRGCITMILTKIFIIEEKNIPSQQPYRHRTSIYCILHTHIGLHTHIHTVNLHGGAVVTSLNWQMGDLGYIPDSHVASWCRFGWKCLLNTSHLYLCCSLYACTVHNQKDWCLHPEFRVLKMRLMWMLIFS